MNANQTTIHQETLSKLTIKDLYELNEGFQALCNEGCTGEGSEVAYELYSATLDEIVNRQPKTNDEALYKLLSVLDVNDIADHTIGRANAYQEALKVLEVAA